MSKINSIGRIVGDYIVLSKINEKKTRSKYKLKCLICNSIIESYNIPKNRIHDENCINFENFIIGNIIKDYMIIKAYREERIYVDLLCLKCGSIRKHVTYKDFKLNYKNQHGKHCTILNTNHFDNKKLVRKLTRTFANIKTRISNKKSSTPKYLSLQTDFIDTTDFVVYMYPLYKERIENGEDIKNLTIDRIDNRYGYLKKNVRCLTRKEQAYNKENTREYYIDDIRFYGLRSFCKSLKISEREFYKFYNNRNEQIINYKKVFIKDLYDVETIE